ncbi:MAG TPA: PQQ-dependent sugar dehydrogenase, partial [Caulobacteraceae bacterium]|nr:PQQ-dependent sugar dehydrogenase [Caulobacteraceae bacterium]
MRKSVLTFVAMLAASAALAQNRAPPPQPPWIPPAAGQPVENKPPETKLQPAFPGQTRGPYEPTGVDLDVKVITQGLDHPWGLTFLPDGRALVTEKVGRMRVVTMDGKVSPPLGGLPAVDERQGGGMLDVEADPDFKKTRLIYFDYAEARGNGAGLTVARARLVDRPGPDPRLETFEKGAPLVGERGEKITLENVQILFRLRPTEDSYRSFGSRIAFGRGQTMFVTMGDLDFDPYRPLVQDL